MAKLTKNEMLKMENNLLQQQVYERELEIQKLKKSVELLANQVKSLEALKKADVIDKTIETKRKKIEDIKKENREFNEKIKTKYKIEGSFGINPDTGEIIEE